MPEEPGTPSTTMLEYSQVETQRFGFRIFRGTVSGIDEQAVLTALLEGQVDVAIVRLPSDRQYQLTRLDRVGLPYLVADTLVRYQVDLSQYEPARLQNGDLVFAECRPQQQAAVRAIAAEVFNGYRNHYYSNPVLTREAILDAFVDWAQRSAASGAPDHPCWLVSRGAEHVAFITGMRDGERCEAVLGGVRLSARRGGVYSDLIRFTQRHFKERGCRVMTVSTQTQNRAVQRVWVREGFELSSSEVTIHINSMLSRSAAERRSIELKVSEATTELSGESTGDRRSVSLSGRTAQSAGSEDGVLLGPFPAAAICEYYRTEFPGPGTGLLGFRCKLLKPLRSGRSYRLNLSFPFVDQAQGIYQGLATVTDPAGEYYLLAYSELRKEPS